MASPQGTIHIIISCDYESFRGGNPFTQKIEPTSRLLGLLDEVGARATLFCDVCELWAFSELEQRVGLTGVTEATRSQLLRTVALGHDVQLHLHPIFLPNYGHDYHNGKWTWYPDRYRLHDLPCGMGTLDTPYSIKWLLAKGIAELENLLVPIAPSYRCVAFRAGGYCIQPSHDVVLSMLQLGLLADSSVRKGAYRLGPPGLLDFRHAWSNADPWWAMPTDINRPASSPTRTLLEMPIYTRPRTLLHRLLGRWAQWDFCALPYGRLRKMFEHYLQVRKRKSGVVPGVHVLVMQGHPKSFHNERDLRRFLSWLRAIIDGGSIRFSTFQEAVEDYYAHNAPIAVPFHKNERRSHGTCEFDLIVWGPPGEAEFLLPLRWHSQITYAEIINAAGAVVCQQSFGPDVREKRVRFLADDDRYILRLEVTASV